MKILLCHNHYHQIGGEDLCFAEEGELLERHGHEVVRFSLTNRAIEETGRVRLATRTIWNQQVYRRLRALIRRENPGVAHFTNTFPLISPSAYYAARAEGVPVVQALHNYRLVCPNAQLLRDRRPCEDCLGKSVPWPGVLHGCYRASRSATGTVAAMLAIHRAAGTWSRAVDLYYAPSEFARRKLIEGGLAAERVGVKANFVHPDPCQGDGLGGYAVYVGRLSEEKGLHSLLSAWERLGDRMPLKIVGTGPLADEVQRAAARNPSIECLGLRPLEEVLTIIGAARCLVMPSIWFEPFGRTVIEAYAKGTPVIAAKIGALAEIVDDGRTGLHFEPGNASDLASKLERLLDSPGLTSKLRGQARQEYLDRYTAEANYTELMALYSRAGCRQVESAIDRLLRVDGVATPARRATG